LTEAPVACEAHSMTMVMNKTPRLVSEMGRAPNLRCRSHYYKWIEWTPESGLRAGFWRELIGCCAVLLTVRAMIK
jgi:hypothetical protein